jgi:hypothetical protein
MILDYFKDLDSIKHSLEIVSNFKSGLTTHLLGSRKTELVVPKDIVYTLASNQYVSNNRMLPRCWGWKDETSRK